MFDARAPLKLFRLLVTAARTVDGIIDAASIQNARDALKAGGRARAIRGALELSQAAEADGQVTAISV